MSIKSNKSLCQDNKKKCSGKDLYVYPTIDKFIFNSSDVIMVSCGHDHMGFITVKHDLYMWGSNDKGQLGHHIKKKGIKRKIVSHVNKVICNNNWTIYIDNDKNSYITGEIGINEINRQFKLYFSDVIDATLIFSLTVPRQYAIIRSSGHLDVLSEDDKFTDQFGHSLTTMDTNVQSLCQRNTYITYIKDNHLIRINWNQDYMPYWIDNNVILSVNDFILEDDGKLYANQLDNKKLIATDVQQFDALSDGSCVYIKNDQSLYLAGPAISHFSDLSTDMLMPIIDRLSFQDWNRIQERLPEQSWWSANRILPANIDILKNIIMSLPINQLIPLLFIHADDFISSYITISIPIFQDCSFVSLSPNFLAILSFSSSQY